MQFRPQDSNKPEHMKACAAGAFAPDPRVIIETLRILISEKPQQAHLVSQ